jgi:hypothetical protein
MVFYAPQIGALFTPTIISIFGDPTYDKSCLAWLKPSVFWREVFLDRLTGLNQVQQY